MDMDMLQFLHYGGKTPDLVPWSHLGPFSTLVVFISYPIKIIHVKKYIYKKNIHRLERHIKKYKVYMEREYK